MPFSEKQIIHDIKEQKLQIELIEELLFVESPTPIIIDLRIRWIWYPFPIQL